MDFQHTVFETCFGLVLGYICRQYHDTPQRPVHSLPHVISFGFLFGLSFAFAGYLKGPRV